MKFCFCFLFGLALWQTSNAQANVSDDEMRKYAISSLYPKGEEENPNEKYFVIWQGKPTAFSIHVQAGANIPSNINGYGGSVEPDIAGIKARVRAFDAQNKDVGQINKLGKADDTFLTGQQCTFIPPKPGFYRLTLEVLSSDGQVIPVFKTPKTKTDVQAMSLLVYSPPKPEMQLSYSGWRETSGKTDLYERKISIGCKNNGAMIPKGYSYLVKRTDIPRWANVKLRVEPRLRLKNLSAETLKQISWLSTAQARVDLMGYGSSPQNIIQYFRYDPTRDTPRGLDFYTVKAQVTP